MTPMSKICPACNDTYMRHAVHICLVKFTPRNFVDAAEAAGVQVETTAQTFDTPQELSATIAAVEKFLVAHPDAENAEFLAELKRKAQASLSKREEVASEPEIAPCGFNSCKHHPAKHRGKKTARGLACIVPGCPCVGFVVLGQCGGCQRPFEECGCPCNEDGSVAGREKGMNLTIDVKFKQGDAQGVLKERSTNTLEEFKLSLGAYDKLMFGRWPDAEPPAKYSRGLAAALKHASAHRDCHVLLYGYQGARIELTDCMTWGVQCVKTISPGGAQLLELSNGSTVLVARGGPSHDMLGVEANHLLARVAQAVDAEMFDEGAPLTEEKMQALVRDVKSSQMTLAGRAFNDVSATLARFAERFVFDLAQRYPRYRCYEPGAGVHGDMLIKPAELERDLKHALEREYARVRPEPQQLPRPYVTAAMLATRADLFVKQQKNRLLALMPRPDAASVMITYALQCAIEFGRELESSYQAETGAQESARRLAAQKMNTLRFFTGRDLHPPVETGKLRPGIERLKRELENGRIYLPGESVEDIYSTAGPERMHLDMARGHKDSAQPLRTSAPARLAEVEPADLTRHDSPNQEFACGSFREEPPAFGHEREPYIPGRNELKVERGDREVMIGGKGGGGKTEAITQRAPVAAILARLHNVELSKTECAEIVGLAYTRARKDKTPPKPAEWECGGREPLTPGSFAYHVVNDLRNRHLISAPTADSFSARSISAVIAQHYALAAARTAHPLADSATLTCSDPRAARAELFAERVVADLIRRSRAAAVPLVNVLGRNKLVEVIAMHYDQAAVRAHTSIDFCERVELEEVECHKSNQFVGRDSAGREWRVYLNDDTSVNTFDAPWGGVYFGEAGITGEYVRDPEARPRVLSALVYLIPQQSAPLIVPDSCELQYAEAQAPDEIAALVVQEFLRVDNHTPGVTPGEDTGTFTRAELVHLVAQGIGRATTPVLSTDELRPEPANERRPDYYDNLCRWNFAEAPLAKVSAAGLSLPASARIAPAQPSHVAAFDIAAEAFDVTRDLTKQLHAQQRYDAVKDRFTITAQEMEAAVTKGMQKLAASYGAPVGTWQIGIDVQEQRAQGQVRIELTSSRGMGFIFYVADKASARTAVQKALAFAYSHDLHPDERNVLVTIAAYVKDLQVERALEAARCEASGSPYTEQSMIDLRVAAAEEGVAEAVRLFWATGRMRTHENRQLEKLFTEAKRRILALDPARFARGGAA